MLCSLAKNPPHTNVRTFALGSLAGSWQPAFAKSHAPGAGRDEGLPQAPRSVRMRFDASTNDLGQLGSMLAKDTRGQTEARHESVGEMAVAAETCRQPNSEQIVLCLPQQEACSTQAALQDVLRRGRSKGGAEGDQQLIRLQRSERCEIGQP